MIVIPDAKPSKPSNQFIALVIPVSQIIVIKNFINTGKLIIIFVIIVDQLFYIYTDEKS